MYGIDGNGWRVVVVMAVVRVAVMIRKNLSICMLGGGIVLVLVAVLVVIVVTSTTTITTTTTTITATTTTTNTNTTSTIAHRAPVHLESYS